MQEIKEEFLRLIATVKGEVSALESEQAEFYWGALRSPNLMPILRGATEALNDSGVWGDALFVNHAAVLMVQAPSGAAYRHSLEFHVNRTTRTVICTSSVNPSCRHHITLDYLSNEGIAGLVKNFVEEVLRAPVA